MHRPATGHRGGGHSAVQCVEDKDVVAVLDAGMKGFVREAGEERQVPQVHGIPSSLQK